jgi:hypothetical protein
VTTLGATPVAPSSPTPTPAAPGPATPAAVTPQGEAAAGGPGLAGDEAPLLAPAAPGPATPAAVTGRTVISTEWGSSTPAAGSAGGLGLPAGGPRLRARLVAPAAPVPPPSSGPDAGTTAEIAEAPAPATRAAVTGRTLVATESGSSTPGAPGAGEWGSALAGAGSVVAPGEVQVWDLPDGGAADGGRWLVSGPGAARVTFLDRAGRPLRDVEVAPGPVEEAAVTTPPEAARVAVAAPGRTEPGVSGWQSGSLLAQVGRSTLLAPRASVHLEAPLLTRRDGLRTSQALVRAATAVGPADTVETRLRGDVEVVVVIVDAPAGAEPGTLPVVAIDGAAPGEPTVVAGGHRLYLAYSHSATTEGSGGGDGTVTVRVTTGAGWELAGVLGGPGNIDDWLPAITGAGSGVAVAPPVPTGPVTVRYEAPAPREAP